MLRETLSRTEEMNDLTKCVSGYLVIKPGSQHWGQCMFVNVGPVSIWEVIEPFRTPRTLAMNTLSFSIEKSAWHKCSEKD